MPVTTFAPTTTAYADDRTHTLREARALRAVEGD
jgi:hypothetical protein